jgi:long-chain acyl-CoA synthetase
MCQTFIQGYGLTETNGASCIQDFNDCRDGIAGSPCSSVELRLHDCPEVNDSAGSPYLSADRVHSVVKENSTAKVPCLGRGELWIRGGTVADGYFKMPEKTASEFTGDGWFKTGDICIFTKDGSVKIVDRLKNLLKLRGGEYIAIENMEKEYAKSKYVDDKNGGVMVVARSGMDRACLLMQANLVAVKALADSLSIQGDDLELCSNKEVRKAILKDLQSTCAPQLSKLEKIVGVGLLPGIGALTDPIGPESPWTPENGGLTASNKLNRKPIENCPALKPIIEELVATGTF